MADPGPMTTVQDRGRRGWAHLGVPRSGALDLPAAELANRLVGNPVDAAVLETTLGGVTFRVSVAMTVAVTGADADVTVDGRHRAFGEAIALHAGQTVVVGPARSGLRSYVACAGGIDVPRVLGSRSTDTLSGIGPERLAAGAVLRVGDPVGEPRGVDVPVVRSVVPSVSLRFAPGPRHDWFTEQALETLAGSSYTVSSDSNRVGLRLHGPRLARDRVEELPSEGIVLGAIQVPASGEPLVFLNDHPTTGGYPVLGVVLSDDLPRCAQLRPGDVVRFRA
ncbi:MAG: biotin-dependent carboxyltransferase family protein [Nocardioidaceae bacterium]